MRQREPWHDLREGELQEVPQHARAGPGEALGSEDKGVRLAQPTPAGPCILGSNMREYS
jgi:hypothetical protein